MEQWIPQPQWLWLLALAPVIFALHLLRFRPKTLVVPSTRLWRDTLQEDVANQWLQPIKRWLSLVLQLIALVLLSLACAGMQWPEAKRKGRNLLVVLDASSSMAAIDPETQIRRFDLAMNWLENEAKSAWPEDRFGVATLGSTYRIEVPVGSSPSEILARLDKLRTTELSPCPGAMLSASLASLVPQTRQGTEVAFVSGPIDESVLATFSSQIGVVGLGNPVPNRAILSIDATTGLTGHLKLSVAIDSRGTDASTLVLQQQQEAHWKSIAARKTPETVGVVDFELPPNADRQGKWRVIFEQGDLYAADDSVELWLEPWVELAPPPLPDSAKELRDLLLSLGAVKTGSIPKGSISISSAKPDRDSSEALIPLAYAQDAWLQGLVKEELFLQPSALVPAPAGFEPEGVLIWLGDQPALRRNTANGKVDLEFFFQPDDHFLKSNTALVLLGRWLDAQRQVNVVRKQHLSPDESREVRLGSPIDSLTSAAGESEELVAWPLAPWLILLAAAVIGLEWWLYRRKSLNRHLRTRPA